MPHDVGPGWFRQVGAGVPVAEHPPVVPELTEFPEVPAGDPVFRLVRVAPARPLVSEPPQVIGQGSEHPGRHHRPVVGDPAPCDRDNFRQYRCDVGPAECAELLRKPVPEPLDGRGARFDQQLSVRIAAEIKSQEIEPLSNGDDPGFGFVKSQPSRLQPLGQPCPDLLGLLPGMAAYHQVIGVPDERRAAVLHRSGMNAAPVSDACGLLQPVQCDIQQQRRNNTALGSSFPGRREPFPGLEDPCFQPPGDNLPRGETAEHFQQVLVADLVECACQVRVQYPHPLGFPAQGAEQRLYRVMAAAARPEPIRPRSPERMPLTCADCS